VEKKKQKPSSTRQPWVKDFGQKWVRVVEGIRRKGLTIRTQGTDERRSEFTKKGGAYRVLVVKMRAERGRSEEGEKFSSYRMPRERATWGDRHRVTKGLDLKGGTAERLGTASPSRRRSAE